MILANLPYQTNKNSTQVIAMHSINYSDMMQDGDLAYAHNLSARRYPYISTRKAREQQEGMTGVTALAARDVLISVSGTTLYYNNTPVGTVSAGEKQFAFVNTKVVIWPDKKYLDLNTMTLENLTASEAGVGATFTDSRMKVGVNTLEGEGATFTTTTVTIAWDGVDLTEMFSDGEDVTISGCTVAPENNLNATIVSVTATTLTFGAGTFTAGTETGNITFTKTLDSAWPDLTTIFKPGDAVFITGCTDLPANNISVIIRQVTSDELILSYTGSGKTQTFTPGNETGAITIERRIPDLDFICESGNRLWGVDNDTQTIFASALGDPTNFYTYDGLSTDSYAVAVGSEGAFTGCCKLSSSILFWKEAKLHKMLGSFPAEYSLYSYDIEGLQAGCAKSMSIINDTLFYKGPHGVYTYSGGTPQLISANFGTKEFTDAVGGNDGDTYYLCMTDSDNERNLFAFETQYGLWVREDNADVVDFARIGKQLYFCDGDGNVYLETGTQDDPDIEWEAQFTPFYETLYGRKKFLKMTIRMQLPKGSYMIAEIRKDEGLWKDTGKIIGKTNDIVSLRIPINRCDRFEIRLKGKGPCTILGLLGDFTLGSDV